MGEQGSRGVRHTRLDFSSAEFSHSSTSLRATDISRGGLPAQTDANLMVNHHSFHTEQNIGGAGVNQVILDIYLFKNSGTWVEQDERHTPVSCGHFVLNPRLENWQFCGKSAHGQDGCAPADVGATVEFVVRFTDVAHWKSVGTESDSVRLASPQSPPPAAFSRIVFDTDFASENVMLARHEYAHARIWHPPAAGASQSQRRDGRTSGTTICHRTSSKTKPFVVITVDESALEAHEGHDDIIPASTTGCMPGAWHKNHDAEWTISPQTREAADECVPSFLGGGRRVAAGKVSICHATRSSTNPYTLITVDESAVPAHEAHQHGEDIIPAPESGCSACTAISNPALCRNTGGCRHMSACGCIPVRTCMMFMLCVRARVRVCARVREGKRCTHDVYDVCARASACVCACERIRGGGSVFACDTRGLGQESCMCGDQCCISGLCSSEGGGAVSGGACEIFAPSLRREDESNEVMSLRFPRGSAGSDSYSHSSLIWLGGDVDSGKC